MSQIIHRPNTDTTYIREHAAAAGVGTNSSGPTNNHGGRQSAEVARGVVRVALNGLSAAVGAALGCRISPDYTDKSSPIRSISFSILNGFFTNSSAPDLSRSLISSWLTTPETMMIFTCSKFGFFRIVWQTTLPLMSGSM